MGNLVLEAPQINQMLFLENWAGQQYTDKLLKPGQPLTGTPTMPL